METYELRLDGPDLWGKPLDACVLQDVVCHLRDARGLFVVLYREESAGDDSSTHSAHLLFWSQGARGRISANQMHPKSNVATKPKRVAEANWAGNPYHIRAEDPNWAVRGWQGTRARRGWEPIARDAVPEVVERTPGRALVRNEGRHTYSFNGDFNTFVPFFDFIRKDDLGELLASNAPHPRSREAA